MDSEILKSWNDVADELGVTTEELIKVAKENGLIDDQGNATQFAIDNGLLVNVGGSSLN